MNGSLIRIICIYVMRKKWRARDRQKETVKIKIDLNGKQ